MNVLIKVLCLSLVFIMNLSHADTLTDSPYYRAGDFVFISAQVGINPETGKMINDNLSDQIDQVFKNLQTTAKQAGGSLQNVVKLTVYMEDLDTTFPLVKKAIPGYFKPPYPARTPVGGVRLGKQRLVSIDAVMYLPGQKKLN